MPLLLVGTTSSFLSDVSFVTPLFLSDSFSGEK